MRDTVHTYDRPRTALVRLLLLLEERVKVFPISRVGKEVPNPTIPMYTRVGDRVEW